MTSGTIKKLERVNTRTLFLIVGPMFVRKPRLIALKKTRKTMKLLRISLNWKFYWV